MMTYPDPHIPAEAPEEMTSVTPPADVPAEASAETAVEAVAETTAKTAVASPVATVAPAVAPPAPQPWPIIVRRFTIAPAHAYRQLNKDFGLSLDARSYNRLQTLFRDVLRRDPTVGEILLLDTLERSNKHAPCRESVGELYTDSPAIAETWADMMAKHSELYAAAGLLRKGLRTPPPCTLEDALTLIGRYLHRTGRVSPLTDNLPFGGKNSDGRTAVLCTPAQEAEAIAQGYVPVKSLDFGTTTRSLWVRRGGETVETPAANGDFLILLPAPDPNRLVAFLAAERGKKHPTVGALVPMVNRSPLEAVAALCDGADVFPARFPQPADEMQDGSAVLLSLCKTSIPHPDAHPDYLLRVPARRVRELSEALPAAGITAVSVGQVKTDGKIRILLRKGRVDVPVAHLNTQLLCANPDPVLYRRRVEATPREECPAATVLELPEEGLIMAATAITVTDPDTGYAAAMNAVAAAMAPLTADGGSTARIRLSVSLTVSDNESGLGNRSLGVLCGLYRAAAEGCMAMEDPAFTVPPRDKEQDAPIRLSVVAYRLP